MQHAGIQDGPQEAGQPTGQVNTIGGGGGGGSGGAGQAGTMHAGVTGQAVIMVHPGTVWARSGVWGHLPSWQPEST